MHAAAQLFTGFTELCDVSLTMAFGLGCASGDCLACLSVCTTNQSTGVYIAAQNNREAWRGCWAGLVRLVATSN